MCVASVVNAELHAPRLDKYQYLLLANCIQQATPAKHHLSELVETLAELSECETAYRSTMAQHDMQLLLRSITVFFVTVQPPAADAHASAVLETQCVLA